MSYNMPSSMIVLIKGGGGCIGYGGPGILTYNPGKFVRLISVCWQVWLRTLNLIMPAVLNVAL